MKAAGLLQLGNGADGDAIEPRSAVAQLTDRCFANSDARSELPRAWSATSVSWRAACVLTGLAALGATRFDAVPLASGCAVAVIVAAALVDVHQRRLPNRIVLVGALVVIAGTAADLVRGHNTQPTSIVIGAAAMAGPLFLLHLASPSSMGFGDVKAAAVLGGALAMVDWQLAVSALALAAGTTATVGVLRRMRHIAFGPGLAFAATVALMAHPLLLPGAGAMSPTGATPPSLFPTDLTLDEELVP